MLRGELTAAEEQELALDADPETPEERLHRR
jgi:hypothetical protein